MDDLTKYAAASTRLTLAEHRELLRACKALRVRRSEFIRRAIERLVAETLAKPDGKRDGEAA